MDSIQNAISESSHPGTGRRSISLKGKIILGITGGIGIGLTVVCLPFVSPALRKHCLPYVPATTQQVKNVLYAVQKENPSSRNVRLLDIGSGDGRIVIESAKQGHTSHGVELNPWLVYYSRLNAYRMGVWNKTKFYRKNLWNFNVSGYNNIVIFGVDGMMADLEKKLLLEVQPKGLVVACRFPFPNLTPLWIKEEGIDSIWVYKVK